MNITVKHRELAWATAPNDKYFIAEYRIKNNNASALNNIFAGMFFDWDIVNSKKDELINSGKEIIEYEYQNSISSF